jgi:hypothetical protein
LETMPSLSDDEPIQWPQICIICAVTIKSADEAWNHTSCQCIMGDRPFYLVMFPEAPKAQMQDWKLLREAGDPVLKGWFTVSESRHAV